MPDQSLTRNLTVYSLLGLLACLSYYATWGLYEAVGVIGTLEAAIADPDYIHPGTTTPILRKFTGFAPIDHTLTILILVFAPAVDGQSPSFSLFCAHFAAQAFPASVAVYAESFRRKNLGKWWLSPTFWLTLAQFVGLANSAPWFVALWMLTDSAQSSQNVALLRDQNATDPLAILLLPVSHLLGHILPCILMAWRSNTWETTQWWIVIWQFYPVLVTVAQSMLTAFIRMIGGSSVTKMSRSSSLTAIRIAYGFSIFIAAATHIATLTLTFCAVCFPEMFNPEYAAALHPERVLVLHTYSTENPGQDLNEAILGFLQWDQVCAYATMLVWAMNSFVKDHESATGKAASLPGTAIKVGLGYLVLGPGAVVLLVQWAREEVVYAPRANKGQMSQ